MDDIIKDHKRLKEFSRQRRSRWKLTKEEDVEEAHLTVRLAALASSPEITARSRLKESKARFRISRAGGPPIGLAEESELRSLSTLYPEPSSPANTTRANSLSSAFSNEGSDGELNT
jgi:hypothetical protein